jgi:hypothetical protein
VKRRLFATKVIADIWPWNCDVSLGRCVSNRSLDSQATASKGTYALVSRIEIVFWPLAPFE